MFVPRTKERKLPGTYFTIHLEGVSSRRQRGRGHYNVRETIYVSNLYVELLQFGDEMGRWRRPGNDCPHWFVESLRFGRVEDPNLLVETYKFHDKLASFSRIRRFDLPVL